MDWQTWTETVGRHIITSVALKIGGGETCCKKCFAKRLDDKSPCQTIAMDRDDFLLNAARLFYNGDIDKLKSDLEGKCKIVIDHNHYTCEDFGDSHQSGSDFEA